MHRTRLAAFGLLSVLAALPLGCKSPDNAPPSRGGAVDSGDVKLEIMPSALVDVIQPTVEMQKGTSSIAGRVQRKPGVSQFLAGRIDVEFLDRDGDILDSLPVLLSPQKIPMDAGTPCFFHTDYDYVPPKGSTVRLHFVDSDTAAREDLAGGHFETGKNTGFGGQRPGGAAHTATGSRLQ